MRRWEERWDGDVCPFGDGSRWAHAPAWRSPVQRALGPGARRPWVVEAPGATPYGSRLPWSVLCGPWGRGVRLASINSSRRLAVESGYYNSYLC